MVSARTTIDDARSSAVVVLLLLLGCSGTSDGPVVQGADSTPPSTTATSLAEPAASAPATAPTGAASAVASASAAPPAPVAPSSQGKCPTGMAEFSGGKFKSTYYRAELKVEPFCLDLNLATTDEYTACIATGKCDKGAIHACDPSTYNIEGRGKLPMICVDFGQAERYCKAQGKRIVSDLEWEWAARGGDEARAYPWGSDAPADQLCWSGKEKRTLPCPVGTYGQGSAGVFDLVGNIYQWTTTTNDSTGSFRVGRGGSWKDTKPEQVAVSNKGGFKNTYRCGFLGIRCSAPVP
jgi:formylglycine-generating enzyme required for sulfatase activity